MATRPNPHDTLQLSLALLHAIPKRRAITATALQQKLADEGFVREPRTIQRLLENLCDSDRYGIERDMSSKPYLYRWKASAAGLSMGRLTPHECLLLTLAEQQLHSLLPSRLMRSMGDFFEQARHQLDDAPDAGRERAWLDKVRVVSTSQPLLPPKIDPVVFEQVSLALYGNQWLDVIYHSAADKRITARVMPLGLAQQGPRMYLVCRFDGYDDERCLALHRMQSAQALAWTFERPADFDLQQWDADGRFGFGDGVRVQLCFRIGRSEGRHIVECPLSLDQRVIEHDDGYDITATVVDSAMLDWWLRGFGDAVSWVQKTVITT